MKNEDCAGFEIDDYLEAYMEEYARKYGKNSERQAALRLGITPAALNQYRAGSRVMDDYCASQIATFLRLDPMLVIASANEKRAKTGPRKEHWREIQICLTTGGSLVTALFFSVAILGQSPDIPFIYASRYILCKIRYLITKLSTGRQVRHIFGVPFFQSFQALA